MPCNKKRKGFSVANIGPLALAVLIGAIVIGIGASLTSDVAKTQCEKAGYTFGTYNGTGGICCQTVAGSNCGVFYRGDYSVNASLKGLDSMTTFGNWMPTIALVIVFAIIIGVIMVYLGRSSSM